jgi:hypothetical protein
MKVDKVEYVLDAGKILTSTPVVLWGKTSKTARATNRR